MGINRNIVECKFHRSIQPSGRSLCINRNIVECKYATKDAAKAANGVLIETLWNVNIKKKLYCVISRRSVLIETLWNVNKSVRGRQTQNSLY